MFTKKKKNNDAIPFYTENHKLGQYRLTKYRDGDCDHFCHYGGKKKFELLYPNPNCQNSTCIISGSSGVGKTRLARDLVKKYISQTGNDAFVVTPDTDDESLEGSGLIPLDPNAFDDYEGGLLGLEDCLVLIDDYQALPQKKEVLDFANCIATTGRHHDVSLMLITHKLEARPKQMADILNQAYYIYCFPNACVRGVLKYLLHHHLCLSSESQKLIFDTNSDFVCICLKCGNEYKHPPIMIADHEIWKLD